MRTVLARLIALGALSMVVGCAGNSTTPLAISGGPNGTGGANTATTTGSTTGGTGVSTAAVVCGPVSIATGGVVTCPAALGYSDTFAFPANVVIPAGATFTMTTQISPAIAGAPAVPAGSFALQYGTFTIAPAPTAGTQTPKLQIIFPANSFPGRATITAAFVNAAGATVTSTATLGAGQATIPSVTFTYPASGTVLFTIYVT
ncbi:MAG: hypothetical protein JO140_04395 [Candidatus Eremiobacteraeota bacterium]|nr:hypothetical protein [Candidatus Eremiobacteraeota bacterium]